MKISGYCKCLQKFTMSAPHCGSGTLVLNIHLSKGGPTIQNNNNNNSYNNIPALLFWYFINFNLFTNNQSISDRFAHCILTQSYDLGGSSFVVCYTHWVGVVSIIHVGCVNLRGEAPIILLYDVFVIFA